MYHRTVNNRLLFKQLTMLIVKIYTLLLFVFSSITNINCEMNREKQLIYSSRSSRQFRPILGSIVFLLAANLVAKGVLGLNAYNNILPNQNNVQGSLYVQFGQKPTHQHQVIPYDPSYWNPTIPSHNPSSTPTPQAVHQQQIINILESPPVDDYSDVDDTQPMANPKRYLENSIPHFEPLIHNKFKREIPLCSDLKKRETSNENERNNPKSIIDLLCFSAEQQEAIEKFLNIKRDATKRNQQNKKDAAIKKKQQIREDMMETTTEINYDEDVEYVDGATSAPEVTTIGRQMQSTTPTTTMTTTPQTTVTSPSTTVTSPSTTVTTPSTTVSSTTRATSTTSRLTTTVASTTMMSNETGYNYSVNGYGPYTGNENVSLTTMQPETSTATTMMAGNETNATTSSPGYYYPSGEYGPSNGNENISITYGPPSNYDQIYRPFSSSPVDHFLNNQYQHDYGQYYHDQKFYDNKPYEHNHDYNHDHNHDHHNHDHNHNHHHEHNPYDDQKHFENHYGTGSSGYGYNHFPDVSKYNDIVHKFYNKYDYHYPSALNNFFKK